MRTAELARDDALCRSVVQGGWKGFVAWSWIFVDRTDTRIVGAGKRFWVRMFRASFKIVLFAAMRTLFSHYHTVTSVRIWWDGTPWYSPKLYLASLGMGLAFYIWMGGVADLLIGISEPVLGIRMRDMFDSPFLASSVRGFWARRWNGMYQEALANVFAGKRLPTDTKKTDDETVCAPDAGVPAPMTFPTGPREPTSFLRALAVFVLSGIFHDHINLITFHVRSLNTTLFFVIQCLLCFAEMRLSRTAWYKRTGKWVRWAACLTVLGIAAPLFVGCYIRAGAVLALPFF
ncbi:hypothetical protein HKX48_004271 [Thoreauomyces humboldtii]|nr:hypothetical protein HKX48_004271 [Thoreauomyces humboldtii]